MLDVFVPSRSVISTIRAVFIKSLAGEVVRFLPLPLPLQPFMDGFLFLLRASGRVGRGLASRAPWSGGGSRSTGSALGAATCPPVGGQ